MKLKSFTKKLMRVVMASAIVMIFFVKAFSQQDPGPNPDGPPPAMPMDKDMHIMFAAAGVVFALVVYRRLQAQHTNASRQPS